MDWDRDEDITADAGARPSRSHDLRQWLDKTPLPVVLERVQAGARRPVVRGTPLELHDASRLTRRQANGHSSRFLETARQRPATAGTDDLALCPAAGARR